MTVSNSVFHNSCTKFQVLTSSPAVISSFVKIAFRHIIILKKKQKQKNKQDKIHQNKTQLSQSEFYSYSISIVSSEITATLLDNRE